MRYASFLPSWAANGAFLVNRRLKQDVAGFWRWCFMLCTLFVRLCSGAGARRCTDTESDTGADADALYTLYFIPVYWCWCRCWIDRDLHVPVRKAFPLKLHDVYFILCSGAGARLRPLARMRGETASPQKRWLRSSSGDGRRGINTIQVCISPGWRSSSGSGA